MTNVTRLTVFLVICAATTAIHQPARADSPVTVTPDEKKFIESYRKDQITLTDEEKKLLEARRRAQREADQQETAEYHRNFVANACSIYCNDAKACGAGFAVDSQCINHCMAKFDDPKCSTSANQVTNCAVDFSHAIPSRSAMRPPIAPSGTG